MQHPSGTNSGGLLLVLTRRRKYLRIPQARCRWIQVPSSRPLFGGLFFVAGPSYREPGDGESGGIEPTFTPFLRPISLLQPPELSSLEQMLGRIFVWGKGVPSNGLRILACRPCASEPKPSEDSSRPLLTLLECLAREGPSVLNRRNPPRGLRAD